MPRQPLALAVLIVGLLIAAYSSCFFITRKTMEAKLTQTIGLRTTIGSIGFSPLYGIITIKRLAMKNPEGFSDGNLFLLKSCTIHMDLLTLFQDIKCIDSIKLRDIALYAEYNSNGLNLDYFKKAVRAKHENRTYKPKDIGDNPDKKEEKEMKGLRIDSVKVKDIGVNFSSASMSVKSIHFKLPDVVLNDISGPGKKVIKLNELLYTIMSAIIDKVSAQGPETYQNAIKKFLMDQLQNFYKR